MWPKEELHKHILPDNWKEHHGTQNCNTFQKPPHYKEDTLKRNYPAWSTSDARDYTLVDEIWTPDLTTREGQDIPAEKLRHQSWNKKIITPSPAYGSEDGNIADLYTC